MGWRTAVRVLTRFASAETGGEADRAPWGGSFTLLGALIGAALGLTAALSMWLGGSRAGIPLACASIFALELWLTGGQGYSAVIERLERSALPAGQLVAIYARFAVFQAGLLLKILAVGTLAANGLWTWFVLAYALSAAAVWSARVERLPPETSRWTVETIGSCSHWLLAVGLTLAAAWLAAALLSGIVAILAAWFLPKLCTRLLADPADSAAAWLSLLRELMVFSILIIGALRALG